jgi:hypothetical protein
VVARLPPCRPPPILNALQGGTLVGADPDTFVCATTEMLRLDKPEHGGTLVVVGMTIRGELAIGR